jgi:hypothetical protein
MSSTAGSTRFARRPPWRLTGDYPGAARDLALAILCDIRG